MGGTLNCFNISISKQCVWELHTFTPRMCEIIKVTCYMFWFFSPTEKPIRDSYLTLQRLDKMRYKNWKMRQISNVLVINPFLLDIMTLLVPKTTDYNTLDKFFIFTMEIHISIFVVVPQFFPQFMY